MKKQKLARFLQKDSQKLANTLLNLKKGLR